MNTQPETEGEQGEPWPPAPKPNTATDQPGASAVRHNPVDGRLSGRRLGLGRLLKKPWLYSLAYGVLANGLVVDIIVKFAIRAPKGVPIRPMGETLGEAIVSGLLSLIGAVVGVTALAFSGRERIDKSLAVVGLVVGCLPVFTGMALFAPICSAFGIQFEE